MVLRRAKTAKQKKSRIVGGKKNRTKTRRLRGGISANLQSKIKDYNVNCQVKNWYTGKFVDRRGAPACDLRKKSLEELYKQERPDRTQIENDYGVDKNIEINDTITKPKKRWGLW
jgi:hypothetical protein